MIIGIIGVGYVGTAIKEAFKDKFEIRLYDKYKPPYNTAKHLKRLEDCNVIFISVNTPMQIDGSIDLEPVHDSVNKCVLYNNADYRVVCIKSTATSGTTAELYKTFGKPAKLEFVFNPEFLTQNNSVEEFKNTDRIILGSNSKAALEVIKRIYTKASFQCPIICTDFQTAEMVKYASNAFLSTKVTFANELYNICQEFDVDYDRVIELLLHDKRIGKSHWKVPGPDGDRGMGGKCLIKDTNALISLAKSKGYDAYFLKEALRSNLRWRKKHDW